jgi:hypothetical protein
MTWFEVFFPAKDENSLNVTITLEAVNWIGALRTGLGQIGEGAEAISNVVCDVQPDKAIHVTDVNTRRVFRLREVAAPPGRVSALPAAAVPAQPTLPPLPVGLGHDTPSTQQISAASMPPPSVTARAPALPVDTSETIPDTTPMISAPGPTTKLITPVRLAEIPEAESTAKVKIAPASREVLEALDAKHTVAKTERTLEVAQPAPESVRAAQKPEPVAPPKPEPKRVELPRAAPLDAKKAESKKPEPVEAKKDERKDDKKRDISVPPPKRDGGQFNAAPSASTRTESVKAPTDPAIDVSVLRASEGTSVVDAIGDVFDATQDLMTERKLTASKIAEALLDIALKYIPSEAASFYVADVNGHELAFAAVRGPKADAIKKANVTVKVGSGIVGVCAQDGICLLVTDMASDPRFETSISELVGYKPRDTLCASAEKDGRLFGAIQLINSKRAYDANHMEVLRYIGLTAAELLERVHNAS